MTTPAGWTTASLPAPQPLESGGELAWQTTAKLGEGPTWDQERASLLMVDIFAGQVHRLRPSTGTVDTLTVGPPVSSVLPTASGGLILTGKDSLLAVTPDGETVTEVARFPGIGGEERMNDAKCDPEGRLFAGSMTEIGTQSALYRVGAELDIEMVLEGVGISNGLAWSADRKWMYYIDSVSGSIDRFSYDRASGEIDDRSVVVRIDPGRGAPDGMCIDAEDHLWVAVFGGGVVRRYDPSGLIADEIEVPAPNVTSCCFGGDGYRDLYVTTAWAGLGEDEKERFPLSGSVFRFNPAVGGTAPFSFAGSI